LAEACGRLKPHLAAPALPDPRGHVYRGLTRLMGVHHAWDNEPPFAERLDELTAQSAVPETAMKEFASTRRHVFRRKRPQDFAGGRRVLHPDNSVVVASKNRGAVHAPGEAGKRSASESQTNSATPLS
jgi:hypothetical protein